MRTPEYVPVRVNGMARQYLINKVFIRWEPPEDDGKTIQVRVVYPSWGLDGEITFATMKRLLEYGLRAKVDVHTGEDHYVRLIRSIEETKREMAERKKQENV